MIFVKVEEQDNLIHQFEVSGHANSASHGYDLVCAGVSCIVTGLANAVDQLCGDSAIIDLAEGYAKITVINQSQQLETILKTGLIQLMMMAEQYPKYIKMK
jgi:uncharacterized protein